MSKFDIRAVKVGKRVSTDMKLSLNEFNKKYVGIVYSQKRTELHAYWSSSRINHIHWNYMISTLKGTSPKAYPQ